MPSDKSEQETGFKAGPILLLGAPGVGKGTQARVLMKHFGIPQISTGDILRDHRARHTALGLAADDLMSRGELVSDAVVNGMVQDRLADPDCESGYILDGYPRTLAQADALDHFLLAGSATNAGSDPDAFGYGAALPVIAVLLQVQVDRLLERVTGRRSCTACHHIYNIYFSPPAQEGVCDFDGSPLEQRKDDTEPVFHRRMVEFHNLTAPVIPHYRDLGRFLEIDGDRSVSEVTASIIAVLRRYRSH